MFSLLSNCTTPADELNASPWFATEPITQLCTVDVTSNVTNTPADETFPVSTTAPSTGSVAYVTVPSLHDDPTTCTATVPGVSARLQYTFSTARVICDAVVPAGNTPRSNCTSAVYPLPTFRLLNPPAFTVGCALDTCASPTSVACCACVAIHASNKTTSGPTLRIRSTPFNPNLTQQ